MDWATDVSCTLLRGGDERPIGGRTENVSTGGALIATRARLEQGQALVLDIVSRDPPLVCRRVAAVVRECPPVDGWNRCALEFETASPASRAQLTAALIVVASRSGQRAPLG